MVREEAITEFKMRDCELWIFHRLRNFQMDDAIVKV